MYIYIYIYIYIYMSQFYFYCTRLTCLTLCTDFLRTPMLTILSFMHTAKPNHVRRQLSKSQSASKILIGGCQTVWHGTWQQLAKVLYSTIRIGDVNIRVSTEVTCLGIVLDSEIKLTTHVRRLRGVLAIQLRGKFRGPLAPDCWLRVRSLRW